MIRRESDTERRRERRNALTATSSWTRGIQSTVCVHKLQKVCVFIITQASLSIQLSDQLTQRDNDSHYKIETNGNQ